MSPAGNARSALAQGREALARGDWALARERFGEALSEQETSEAYEGLGIAARYEIDAAAALDAHQRGYQLARQRGDAAAAAGLAVQLGYDAYAFRGPAEAQGWVQRAEMLLEGQPPSAAGARIPVMRAHLALLADHDPDTARALSEESLRAARAVGAVDEELLSLALNGLAQVSAGEIDAGMRRLDAAAAAALGGEMVDADDIETVCCYLIDACRRVRDVTRAREWCLRVREVATRFSDRQMFAVCRTSYADVLIWHGDWAEAEEELQAAARELAAIRPGREADALVRLAELRRRQGRISEAQGLLSGTGSHPMHPLVEGHIASDRGDATLALDCARRLLHLVGDRDRYERVSALELAVRAAVACGDPSAAAAAAELAGIADATPTVPLNAAARLAQARIAASERQMDDARELLEQAQALYTQAGAPYDAALAELELAAILELSGRTDAAARASERARRALDELGARSAEPRPGGLSEREAQVLRLVARGLSNEDIAQELVLSVRTVERHVANSYAKIGAAGRTARAIATAWAHAHGIG